MAGMSSSSRPLASTVTTAALVVALIVIAGSIDTARAQAGFEVCNRFFNPANFEAIDASGSHPTGPFTDINTAGAGWWDAGGAGWTWPVWISFDADACPTINAVIIDPFGAGEAPRDFQIQVSDDNAAWTTVGTFNVGQPWNDERTFALPANARGQFWRLFITSGHNAARAPTITSFRLQQADCNRDDIEHNCPYTLLTHSDGTFGCYYSTAVEGEATRTQPNGHAMCQDLADGHAAITGGLATMQSEAENSNVFGTWLSGQGAHWFGLIQPVFGDVGVDNGFTPKQRWTNFGGCPHVYESWPVGEPNDCGGGCCNTGCAERNYENCAHNRGDHTWNDLPCGSSLHVVCEFVMNECHARDTDGDRLGDECEIPGCENNNNLGCGNPNVDGGILFITDPACEGTVDTDGDGADDECEECPFNRDRNFADDVCGCGNSVDLDNDMNVDCCSADWGAGGVQAPSWTSVPADVTLDGAINANPDTSTAALGVATAAFNGETPEEDTCGITVTHTDSVRSAGCSGTGTGSVIERTWRASFFQGPQIVHVQTITIRDVDADGDGYCDCVVAGAGTGNCDQCVNDAGKVQPGVCGCGVADSDFDGDGVADCVDNCPEDFNPGQQDANGDGIGDVCACELSISCQADATVSADGTCQADVTLDFAVTQEFCDSVTTAQSGGVDLGLGNHVVTVSATGDDPNEDFAQCGATISVVDTTPPTIQAPPAIAVECTAPTDVSATGDATSADNCGIASLVHADVVTPSCGNTLNIARTFTTTDNSGNSASATQIISVIDTQPPGLTVPAHVTIECGDDESSANTGVATGGDTCGGVTIAESDSIQHLCGNTKVITRTWTATDACGNAVSADQIITVVDTTPPALHVPADITIECTDDESSAN
eukprot:CAMPEP_0203816194 /NCGR_PEP_ID=MMETSP0115-20131106/14387_1 /ASSEMBLY_ACC=CAM_ASM_000227 /TAXON_ID=33651 /ORGANISM="Bicosoecid sp, Strain ms1" /LENGTH=888 /DNA_ID=CAMNT_0050725095 /DNA_START=131 /DNA_END=2794 /DNA_ORIENTATION=+